MWGQININYRGQINCCRVVGEHFVETDTEGTFVNIASDAARVGSMGEAVYSDTKGSVVYLIKTLAREFARNNVNCNLDSVTI